MSEAKIPAAFVSLRLVGASFVLSGLVSALTIVWALRSSGGMLAFRGALLVFFLSSACAASSLRVGRLARVAVGLTITLGAGGSTFMSIATQAMSPPGSFVGDLLYLLPYFVLFFVAPYGIGSVVGLLPMLSYGAKVYAIGVLGFCGGAAIGATLAALGMAISALEIYGIVNVNTMPVYVFLPAIVGPVGLAWALNSLRRRRTAGKP